MMFTSYYLFELIPILSQQSAGGKTGVPQGQRDCFVLWAHTIPFLPLRDTVSSTSVDPSFSFAFRQTHSRLSD